ncbi:MAG: hypothetical protein ACRC9P_06230, partial [Bacteroides sp.]
SVIASDTLSDNASDSTSALYKQNNTIHSIELNGEEALLPEQLVETLNLLLADRSYLEMLCMNFRVHDLELMKNYIKQFFTELSVRGENYKDEKDAKFHFANWLKAELRNKQSYGKKNKSTGAKPYTINPSQQNSWTNPIDTETAGAKAFIDTIAIG